MKNTLFFIIFIFGISETYAQNKNIRRTKQIINYHANGKVKSIENFLTDSCYLVITKGVYKETIKVDTCRYGYFKIYYSNGILKTLGQYDCNLPKQNNLIDTDCLENDCFKSGIWHQFDSLGKLISSTRYECDIDVFNIHHQLKQDTLVAKNDSSLFKIKNYESGKSYFIKRFNKKCNILLDFPKYYAGRIYWYIFEDSLNLLNFPKISLQIHNEDYIKYFMYDATHKKNYKNDIYVNLSNLKSGTYYIYCTDFTEMYLHEIKFIIQDF
ncbi:MAG: hypothetical protein EAZ06_11845 [Cytophagales bacterium]|nr:MAG: hypothetical protein EAZ06_11845 [Cytophagales bacterium]